MTSLNGKIAVISGATGALGQEITHQLASQGVRLALMDHSSERLDNLQASLALPADHLIALDIDLLSGEDVQKASQTITERFGKVDFLLHLVGGWTGGKTLLETEPGEIAFMLNQHLWTTYHVTRAFIPSISKSNQGRIICISSPYASQPSARGGAYAIGKSAQEALILSLSRELLDTNVTANLLLVKTIDTKGTKILSPSTENASWTTPSEIYAAILFLLSEDSRVITGAKIPVYHGNAGL
jgi:NAD(P)-dependent dehydrogenase (short-subunit alcohol dehydrogenase family)